MKLMSTILICMLYLLELSSGKDKDLDKLQLNLEPAVIKSNSDIKCNREQIEIIVSPRSDNKRLWILWNVRSLEKGDWIGLYNKDPLKGNESPVWKTEPQANKGSVKAPVHDKLFPSDKMFKPHCLGFWAVYWRGNEKLAHSCLQTNPTWMAEHKDLIGHTKLRELFIPGSHDSAAYQEKSSPFWRERIDKYIFTQDEKILDQLIFGVRYLDLRAGRHGDSYYAHHGEAKLESMETIIDDIKKFLSSTQEIVIADFHEFPVGFDQKEDVHLKFIEYLEKQFNGYMALPKLSWEATLNDVWKSGKRLIVSYNFKELVQKVPEKVWWPVSQKWGDVKSVTALQGFLSPVIQSKPRYAWSAMAALTPDVWGSILDKYKGLRRMADQTNKDVTFWFGGDWGRVCNIVSVDYVRGSGIVNAAIDWNLLKAVGNKCVKN